MTPASLTPGQRALLAALDAAEWRTVGYRLGPFRPSQADELVRLGLAERRPRARKHGAHEYRLAAAGVAALGAKAQTELPNAPTPDATFMGYGSADALIAARPDLFDAMDCRPGPSGLSDEYSDSLIPEHMRERVLAKRRARRAAISTPAPAPRFLQLRARYPIVLRVVAGEAPTFWNRRTLRWHPFAGKVPADAYEMTRAEVWEWMGHDYRGLDFGRLF